MQDSTGVVRNVIALCFVSLLLLPLLYWYHRSKIAKLRGDKDAVIRDLQRKIYQLEKRNMTANGSLPRRVREEMENLRAKMDMLKDPMEEFRTRVEDIERDIEKYTKRKGDER